MNLIVGLLIGAFAGYQWNQARHRAAGEKAVAEAKAAQEAELLHEQILQEATDQVWEIFHDQMAKMRRKMNQLQEQLDAANAVAANDPLGSYMSEDELFDDYPLARTRRQANPMVK